ncbi:MAG: 30S ribosomal protein S18, partial [Clostridia bacterium]|nr:30S ribosomal protein S18 [Clostridia bacterium]
MTENTNARPARPFVRGKRKKVCIFCADKVDFIDYKDSNKLRKFISERGKILPRRMT